MIAGLLDGKPVTEDAALPLREHGVLLGDSVFETMRAYDGRPFALDRHLERLERSAKWARVQLDTPLATLADEARAVARMVPGDSAVRIFVMRGQKTRRLVFAETLEIREEVYTRGVSACVLPNVDHGTREAAAAKYARYLPRLLARDEARERGFDEALLADEQGRIVSGATASVFAVLAGALVTSTVLEGITRAIVLELARDAKMACVERPIEPQEIARADEMFVTSSLRELVPIVRVGDQVIGAGMPGNATRELHVALRARTKVT